MQFDAQRRTLVAAALLAPVAASAQGGPAAGRDFIEVRPPQPTETGNKIEVIEFFWYGCPHCYNFAPALETWKDKAPADVTYRRVPVAFDKSREPHSRIYYALESLNRVNDLHMKVFQAIHVNKRRLLDPNEIADFMAANGIERKQWLDTYNSFTVATRANRAFQTWQAYKLEGTPSVAIDGRWMTSPSQAGGFPQTLAVMSALVDRARADKRGGKK